MSITAPVLPKDMQKKQVLDEFLHHCNQTHIDGEDHDEIDQLIKYNLIDHALDTRNEELFRKLIAN